MGKWTKLGKTFGNMAKEIGEAAKETASDASDAVKNQVSKVADKADDMRLTAEETAVITAALAWYARAEDTENDIVSQELKEAVHDLIAEEE